MNDVNRNPRRWVDDSGRVRVIEGWHPSDPGRVGYNLMVDDAWLGTFRTLDEAARWAGACAGVRPGEVVLTRHSDTPPRRSTTPRADLRVAPPPPDEE